MLYGIPGIFVLTLPDFLEVGISDFLGSVKEDLSEGMSWVGLAVEILSAAMASHHSAASSLFSNSSQKWPVCPVISTVVSLCLAAEKTSYQQKNYCL